MHCLPQDQFEVKQEHYDPLFFPQGNCLAISKQKYLPFQITPIHASNISETKIPKATNLNFSIQKARSFNTNHWNIQQQQLYCIFLIYFKKYFAREQNRRLTKIFKSMEEFIKTRNSNQCRSHHQKQIKQVINNNVDVLITRLKQNLPKLQQNCAKKQAQLERIRQRLAYSKSYKEQSVNYYDSEHLRRKTSHNELLTHHTGNNMYKMHNMQQPCYFQSGLTNQSFFTNFEKKQNDICLKETGTDYVDQQSHISTKNKRSIFDSQNMGNSKAKHLNQAFMNCSLINNNESEPQERPFKFRISEVHERIQNEMQKSSIMDEQQIIFEAHYHSMMWVLYNQELGKRTSQKFSKF